MDDDTQESAAAGNRSDATEARNRRWKHTRTPSQEAAVENDGAISDGSWGQRGNELSDGEQDNRGQDEDIEVPPLTKDEAARVIQRISRGHSGRLKAKRKLKEEAAKASVPKLLGGGLGLKEVDTYLRDLLGQLHVKNTTGMSDGAAKHYISAAAASARARIHLVAAQRAAEEAAAHMKLAWEGCNEIEDASTSVPSEVSSDEEDVKEKKFRAEMQEKIAAEERENALGNMKELVEARAEEIWKEKEGEKKEELRREFELEYRRRKEEDHQNRIEEQRRRKAMGRSDTKEITIEGEGQAVGSGENAKHKGSHHRHRSQSSRMKDIPEEELAKLEKYADRISKEEHERIKEVFHQHAGESGDRLRSAELKEVLRSVDRNPSDAELMDALLDLVDSLISIAARGIDEDRLLRFLCKVNVGANGVVRLPTLAALAARTRTDLGFTEVGSKKLHLFGLPFDATQREVHILFNSCKGFVSAAIGWAKTCGRPEAIIEFEDPKYAQEALKDREGSTWSHGTYPIRIELAPTDVEGAGAEHSGSDRSLSPTASVSNVNYRFAPTDSIGPSESESRAPSGKTTPRRGRSPRQQAKKFHGKAQAEVAVEKALETKHLKDVERAVELGVAAGLSSSVLRPVKDLLDVSRKRTATVRCVGLETRQRAALADITEALNRSRNSQNVQERIETLERLAQRALNAGLDQRNAVVDTALQLLLHEKRRYEAETNLVHALSNQGQDLRTALEVAKEAGADKELLTKAAFSLAIRRRQEQALHGLSTILLKKRRPALVAHPENDEGKKYTTSRNYSFSKEPFVPSMSMDDVLQQKKHNRLNETLAAMVENEETGGSTGSKTMADKVRSLHGLPEPEKRGISQGDWLDVWSTRSEQYIPAVVSEAVATRCVRDGMMVPAGSIKVSSVEGLLWIAPQDCAVLIRDYLTPPKKSSNFEPRVGMNVELYNHELQRWVAARVVEVSETSGFVDDVCVVSGACRVSSMQRLQWVMPEDFADDLRYHVPEWNVDDPILVWDDTRGEFLKYYVDEILERSQTIDGQFHIAGSIRMSTIAHRNQPSQHRWLEAKDVSRLAKEDEICFEKGEICNVHNSKDDTWGKGKVIQVARQNEWIEAHKVYAGGIKVATRHGSEWFMPHEFADKVRKDMGSASLFTLGEEVETYIDSRDKWVAAVVKDMLNHEARRDGHRYDVGAMKVAFAGGAQWFTALEIGGHIRKAPKPYRVGDKVEAYSQRTNVWRVGVIEDIANERVKVGLKTIEPGSIKVAILSQYHDKSTLLWIVAEDRQANLRRFIPRYNEHDEVWARDGTWTDEWKKARVVRTIKEDEECKVEVGGKLRRVAPGSLELEYAVEDIFDSSTFWIEAHDTEERVRLQRYYNFDLVEVFSRKRQAWDAGWVEEVYEKPAEENGCIIEPGSIRVWTEHYTRLLAGREEVESEMRKANVKFNKGDLIEVYSKSRNMWLGAVCDAVVDDEEALYDGKRHPLGSIKVIAGASQRWIDAQDVANIVRKIGRAHWHVGDRCEYIDIKKERWVQGKIERIVQEATAVNKDGVPVEELRKEQANIEEEEARKRSRRTEINDRLSQTLKPEALQQLANELSFLKEKTGAVYEQFRQDTNKYDNNQDGYFNNEELRNYMRNHLKIPPDLLSDSSINTIFKALDVDDSNSLAGDEFMDFIEFGLQELEKEEQKEQEEEPSEPKEKIKLSISVLSATGLRDADKTGGKSDAYCTIEIQDGKGPLVKTNVKSNTSNPQWNEDLVLKDYIAGQKIVFKVWDKDNSKKEDHLGTAIVTSDLFLKPGGSDVLELKLAEAGKGADATLKVKIIEQEKITLSISVLCATGLRDADKSGGTSDAYCTIEMQDGKGPLAKTKVKSNTSNPQWNEDLILKDYIAGQTIVFKVWDKDNSKKEDFLGTATVTGDLFLKTGGSGVLELKLGEAGKGVDATLKVEIIDQDEKTWMIPAGSIRFIADQIAVEDAAESDEWVWIAPDNAPKCLRKIRRIWTRGDAVLIRSKNEWLPGTVEEVSITTAYHEDEDVDVEAGQIKVCVKSEGKWKHHWLPPLEVEKNVLDAWITWRQGEFAMLHVGDAWHYATVIGVDEQGSEGFHREPGSVHVREWQGRKTWFKPSEVQEKLRKWDPIRDKIPEGIEALDPDDNHWVKAMIEAAADKSVWEEDHIISKGAVKIMMSSRKGQPIRKWILPGELGFAIRPKGGDKNHAPSTSTHPPPPQSVVSDKVAEKKHSSTSTGKTEAEEKASSSKVQKKQGAKERATSKEPQKASKAKAKSGAKKNTP